MKLRDQIISVLIGLVTFGTVLFGFYWLIAALIDKLNTINSDVSKALISAVVAVVGAAVTISLGKVIELRVQIKQDVRAKKIPIYEKQIQLIFDFMFASQRGHKQMSTPQLTNAFSNFTEKLIIWGDSAVIKAWQDFRLHKWGEGGKEVSVIGFQKFEAFIKALRKDIGNDNRNLKDGDLLKLFINDYEETMKTTSDKT